MISSIRKYSAGGIVLLMGAMLLSRGLQAISNPEANPAGWKTASGLSIEGVGMLVVAGICFILGLYRIFKR